jgi:hypothetical protein
MSIFLLPKGLCSEIDTMDTKQRWNEFTGWNGKNGIAKKVGWILETFIAFEKRYADSKHLFITIYAELKL